MRLTETGSVSQRSQCGARTRSGAAMQVGARYRPAEGAECTVAQTAVGAPEGSKNGNYKHGRYTKEVAATRQWLREATHMLRDLKEAPPNDNQNYRELQHEKGNLNMPRKDWPTDPAEIQRSIEEAIQKLVRMGLVVDSGQRRWSQRTGPL